LELESARSFGFGILGALWPLLPPRSALRAASSSTFGILGAQRISVVENRVFHGKEGALFGGFLGIGGAVASAFRGPIILMNDSGSLPVVDEPLFVEMCNTWENRATYGRRNADRWKTPGCFAIQFEVDGKNAIDRCYS
jgi:hypothetical protein